MSDVSRILSQIEAGDRAAASVLLPLVYDELRKLAAAKLAQEKPGQTLQATALVHEAYLRLVDSSQGPQWNGRGHFFGAAAEAMRRILVEVARRRLADKRGGGAARREIQAEDMIELDDPAELLAIHESLDRLAAEDAAAAELVKLRYMVGMTMTDAAESLGISRRQAHYLWEFARSWLRLALRTE